MKRLVLGLLALTGCAENPGGIETPHDAGGAAPVPPRVLVVNTLSETLSTLDITTGELTARAADLGASANRIEIFPGGGGLLVAASGENRVTSHNGRDFAERFGIDLGPGSSPWLAVPLSIAEGLVTNWRSSDLRRLDLLAGSAGPPLALSPGPEGFAVSGRRAWVACTGWQADGQFGEGRLDVVDLDAWSVIARIPVGRNPQEVLVDDAGRIHVLCTGNYGALPVPEWGSVHVVDPAALQVIGIVPLGSSPGRLAAGMGDTIWVAGYYGGLRRYDAASLAVFPDPSDPALRADGLSAVTWDEAGGTAYVTSFDLDLLLAVDGVTLAVVGVWIVGDGPVDVRALRP
ncbi:MAG: YncE family protein [Candidatus Eiseniibacteriota bacterium]